jgi:hypothetical protein
MVYNRRMQGLALVVERSRGRKSLIKFFQPVQLFRWAAIRSTAGQKKDFSLAKGGGLPLPGMPRCNQKEMNRVRG